MKRQWDDGRDDRSVGRERIAIPGERGSLQTSDGYGYVRKLAEQAELADLVVVIRRPFLGVIVSHPAPLADQQAQRQKPDPACVPIIGHVRYIPARRIQLRSG